MPSPSDKPKTAAIVQSNYIPWKGYFDLINSVDEFILYDDMQYTRRDWRNRNKIVTPQGLQWLTIQVQSSGKYFQAIKDTEVADTQWADSHWKTLCLHYGKAPFFKQYKDLFEDVYHQAGEKKFLSEINALFIIEICKLLGITTRISWSMDYHPLAEERTERLMRLCQQVEARHYISGPAAQAYMDESIFLNAGLTLSYMDYSGYPEYAQLHGQPFEHGVSILDLLFNEGSKATQLMNSFQASPQETSAP